MSLCDVMRKIVGESGLSHSELAAKLGRARSYVSVMTNSVCSGRDIGVMRLVAIADACGFDVEVVSRKTGERVTVR